MNHTLTAHKKLEESDEQADQMHNVHWLNTYDIRGVSQLWCILLEIGVWVLVGWPMVSRDQECGYVCVLWGGGGGTIWTTLFCKMQPEATLPSETIVGQSG